MAPAPDVRSVDPKREAAGEPGRRAVRRKVAARRRVVTAAVAIVGIVLLASATWVVVRGILARDALVGAMPLVLSIEKSVMAGDADVMLELDELQRRTAQAHALTSDPIWRSFEVIPWLGSNLSAVRDTATAVDMLATDALPPLADLAGALDLGALMPREGTFDLSPIVAARPTLTTAAEALAVGAERVASIQTEGLLPQVRVAVEGLSGDLARANDVVSSLDRAAQLVPSMLGDTGPRRYLLLFVNNAEVRAGGGIPGAFAEVVAEAGRLEIVAQDSAGAGFQSPPVELTETETVLFDETTGLFMQNATATPQFARTAELAIGMWAARTGRVVDAVVSVDVPALAGLLGATGPITLRDGTQLSEDNAVSVLLSESYARFERPADQDAFFADTARRVFDALTSGAAAPEALIDTLATSLADRRVAVWSSAPAEQALLEQAGLTPGVSATDGTAAVVGVFFNDATGAKMNYYSEAAVSVGVAECRADQRRTRVVEIQLTNGAPHNAATALPEYVTGGGNFGVEPGRVRTKIYVYVPRGSDVYDVRVDDTSVGFLTADHDGLPVVATTVELDPQQTVTIGVFTVAPAGDPGTTVVLHTPLVRDFPVATSRELTCGDI